MRYTLTSAEPAKEVADCLIVGIVDDMRLSHAADELDQASKGYIRRLLAKGDLPVELGKTLLLYSVPGIATARVLLVYCGEEEKFTHPQFRKVMYCVATRIKSMQLDRIANYLPQQEVSDLDFYGRIRHTIELIEDSFYTFDQFKTKKTDKPLYSPPKEFAFSS